MPNDKVKANLVPVLEELANLALTQDSIDSSEANFEGHLFVVDRRDFPGDFLEAAKLATETFASLPKTHKIRQDYEVELIQEGYRLLESGEVELQYLPK